MALELLTFLSLALLLEGVFLALFPSGVRRMLDQFDALTPQQLRTIGLGASVAAVILLTILAKVVGDGAGGAVSFAFPMTRRFVAGLI